MKFCFLVSDAVYSGKLYCFRSTYWLPPDHLEDGVRTFPRNFSRPTLLPDHSLSENTFGPLRLRVTLVQLTEVNDTTRSSVATKSH